MRSIIPWLLLSLTAAVPAASAGPAPAGSAWPATRAGELARGWVTAFNSGEEAMRAFLAARMAARNLAEKNVSVRVERYRSLRERYGRLQLEKVVASEPTELSVRLLDADAKSQTFVFKTESREPWKLLSVSIMEPAHGLHGMFGGFHH